MGMLRSIRVKSTLKLLMVIGLVAMMVSCGPKKPAVKKTAGPTVGMASYYGKKFHGRRTASGERFNMHALTAAHPKLAFGTKVRVINLKNNRSVEVRVNDRGPFVKGRIIDLSRAAAKKIRMLSDGVVKVQIVILK